MAAFTLTVVEARQLRAPTPPDERPGEISLWRDIEDWCGGDIRRMGNGESMLSLPAPEGQVARPGVWLNDWIVKGIDGVARVVSHEDFIVQAFGVIVEEGAA